MTVFFGTSSRSVKFLELAIQNGLKVDLVVSGPPKPIGKKQIITENPVVTTAKSLNIPFILKQFELLNYPKPEIGIIFDFNRIIKKEVIEFFSKGIVNIHFSKLPELRGPAPVQATILKADKQAWITYFLIEEDLDTGPILLQTSLPLDQTETTESLYQKLIVNSASEIIKVSDDYLSGKITPVNQGGTPTYTEKLTTENSQIDWTKSSEEIERLIRAAFPEPVAWTEIVLSIKKPVLRKRLKIVKAHLENEKLVLDLVQLEGKNPVSWKQFKEGYPDSKVEDKIA